MKKFFSLMLVFGFMLLFVQQTTETFPNYVNGLPVASGLGASDQFYVRQGGVSRQVPFSALQGAIGGAVSSFNGRTGAIVPANGDYTFGQIGGLITPSMTTAAPLTAGVVWHGDGTWDAVALSFAGRIGAIIPTTGDYSFSQISGTVGAAQLPTPTTSTLGGVEAVTAITHEWVNAINTLGVPQLSQPAFSDLSGNIAVSQVNNGTGASALTFWAGDNTWKVPPGGGNVATSGVITSGQCPQFNSSTTVIGITCPTGGGGGGTNLGYVNIQTYGAIGDGTCHQLSSSFGSLAAAQVVYPFVSDLTQCVDWAAWMKAVSVAIPGDNTGQPIYCPVGKYVLSNPVMVDQPNNIQGSYAAWATGTTYGNAAHVTYNGLPWRSLGSGNIGNAPTSMNFFPRQLQLDSNDTWPIKMVTITNASPAVFTMVPGLGAPANGTPLVLMTQTYPTPPANTVPALPTGLNRQQVYYVINSTGLSNTFQVSATPGGSAINTSSAGVGTFAINTQVWQLDPVRSSGSFSARVTVIGEDGLTSGNAGCILQTSNGMWMNGLLYLGPESGVMLQGVQVQHETGGGIPTYQCNMFRGHSPNLGSITPPYYDPYYDFFEEHAGIVQMDNGGGSSRAMTQNSGTTGFWVGHEVGFAAGALADSNTWIKNAYDGCIGVDFVETQAFINTMYDNTIKASTAVRGDLNEGVKIIGGNYSLEDSGLANGFAITGLATPGGNVVTATVTTPDQLLLAPICSLYAGHEQATVSSDWANADPMGHACGYNVAILLTPNSGAVPFTIASFNPSTKVITLKMANSYSSPYQGAWGVPADVAGLTMLYLAEMATVSFGQNQIDNVHVENAARATTLSCNCGGFGGARTAEMRHILLTNDQSKGDTVALGQEPAKNTRDWANFLASQTVPFVTSFLSNTLIDSLASGASLYGDRLLVGSGQEGQIEFLHTNSFNPQVPMFHISMTSQNNWTSINGLVNQQLSGGYITYQAGSAFTGAAFDGPFVLRSAAWAGSDVAGTICGGCNNIFMPDFWRTRGLGASKMLGVRPDPTVQACILPSQVTQLTGATLPAITYISQLRGNSFPNVSAGGSGYAVGDTITLNGGTATTRGVVTVQAISGGLGTGPVTSVKVTTAGVYTAEPTFAGGFTQFSTSGGGTGATFNNAYWYVNYNIAYPILFGGSRYIVCDYSGTSAMNSLTHSVWQAKGLGWSYGQNLTTTNVPNLAWTVNGNNPFIYMNQEALELMIPGQNLILTTDGTNSCSTTPQSVQVLEVHPTLGYVKVINSNQDGTPTLPQFGGSGLCHGTTIGQNAYGPSGAGLYNPPN